MKKKAQLTFMQIKMLNRKVVFKGLCILFLAFARHELSAQVKNLFTDKSLPDIEVQTLEGGRINIADFGKKGKIIILNFWATWCAPCKQELSNIHELYEDWQRDYNVELVAVSLDESRNISKVKSYINGNKWNYTVLLDVNQDLRRAFNFQAPPFTVLIDQNGKIVYTHSGYKNGDEYILEDKIKMIAKK